MAASTYTSTDRARVHRSGDLKPPPSDPKTGKVFSEVEGFGIASKHGTPQPYDIVGFAVKAVEDWESILKKHGLR